MKKNLLQKGWPHLSYKLSLRMKLSVLFMFTAFLTMNANNSYSQRTKITLNLENVSVARLLDEIESKTNFRFVYQTREIDLNRKISIKVEKEKVTSIIDRIFQSTETIYKIIDKQIFLRKSSNSKIDNEKDQSDIENTQTQQFQISGTVTDENGTPLPGANIVEKGTTNGVTADFDGNFSLDVPDENAVLVASYVGFLQQEFAVGQQTSFNISLKEDTSKLEEVVVIGYGTQRREELTNAVVGVDSEDFVEGYVSDPAQLIRGKVAGLNIVKPNANPVEKSQISLRGISTLKTGAGPLVIIDGIPGDLSIVAPEDIQSMDVLKDGSAAAIYGTRGSNGVILITTKSNGRNKKNVIELSTYTTVQSIVKELDFMDAKQYRKLVQANKPGAIDYGNNTNWNKEVQRIPFSAVHNLTMRGGDNSSGYSVNLNYRDLEGLIKKSDDNTFNGRITVNHKMFNNKLRLNAGLMGLTRDYFLGSDQVGEGGSFRNDVYRNTLIRNPTDVVRDNEGNLVEHPQVNNYNNPVALLEETIGDRSETNLRFNGKITYSPINNLNLMILASRNIELGLDGYWESKNHISNLRNGLNGYASKRTESTIDNLVELTAQYTLTLENNHNFNILGGYSSQGNVFESTYANNFDFPTNDYTYNNLGAGLALLRGEAVLRSFKQEADLKGYFFRVNYSFKNKYLLMASIRREGSTKFGTDNKWGAFPAISAGWNVGKEDFLKPVTWLGDFKFRVGYGVTGTSPDAAYASLSTLIFSPNAYIDGEWVPTIMPGSNPNPNLRWEEKKEINLGLDFTFLNNRLMGSIDAYKRTTDNMLWDYNVPTPPYLYNTILANAGTMENKGLEFHLDIVPIKTSDFQWSSTINVSTNKNTLVSLSNDRFVVQSGYFDTGFTGEPIQQTTHRIEEGGAIGNFYGYKSIDIDDDGRWIIEGADGQPKSTLDQQADDKQIIGNGIPKWNASWINSFQYKNFNINILMRGAFDYQILNFTKMFYGVPVALTRGNVLTTTYDNVYGERPLNDQQSQDYMSYFIENGDFWKIDNIAIGYDIIFPTTSDFIKKMNVYFSGSNLFTFTNYSGIDPEVNTLGLSPGIDPRDRYPSTRTFTFGLNLTF